MPTPPSTLEGIEEKRVLTESTMKQFTLPRRPELSARRLIVGSALFIAGANNETLFALLNDRLDILTLQGATLVASLYLFLVTVISLVLYVLGHKYTLKPILIFFLILCSVLGYFVHELGIIFDEEMIRSIAETFRDDNRQEAAELVSLSLVLHVFTLGFLPSLIVLFIKPAYEKPTRELFTRVRSAGIMLTILGLMLWGNYRFASFFLRVNRDLRVYVIPTYPIFALEEYARHLTMAKAVPFLVIGEDARQEKPNAHKVVGIMVVGETARADHFSLNGYSRHTNPFLDQEDLINYSHVTSAGTSTAYSVPSMFSFLDKIAYSPEMANRQSNVLDVLERAGVKAFWIDNNSSSKGVANRVKTINLRKHADRSSPWYKDGSYFDQVLLGYLDQCIESTSSDVIIVLHTMGSHGPAYYQRYPEAFAQFTPDCQSSSPQNCSDEEVVNAYDNTILYTDFVLSRLIGFLEEHRSQYESFLFYASDHGESLGEYGIYLHGLPDFLAPKEQTQIPMFAWLSKAYSRSHHRPLTDSITNVDTELSHDNISHTLLGLFDVETRIHSNELDLFSAHDD